MVGMPPDNGVPIEAKWQTNFAFLDMVQRGQKKNSNQDQHLERRGTYKGTDTHLNNRFSPGDAWYLEEQQEPPRRPDRHLERPGTRSRHKDEHSSREVMQFLEFADHLCLRFRASFGRPLCEVGF